MNDVTPPPPRNGAEPKPTDADALSPLRERMLLHVGKSRLWQVRDHIDAAHGGLILCGDGAYAEAALLRRKGFSAPLLVDPGIYELQYATEDEPFPVPAVEDSSEMMSFGEPRFDDPLHSSLYGQLSAGMTAAMTPTGYIAAEDSEALLAAVRQSVAHDDPSVIFTAPVDVSWLRDDNVDQLIAALKLYPAGKALMLGGQMDPLGHFPQAVSNLLRVLQEVPRCALLRSDLAAFGALVHGAWFGSFGATASMRHIVPPGKPADTGKAVMRSPHVLFPELMGFFLGHLIAERFAAAETPRCDCLVCDGAGLDRFTTMKGELQSQAAGHNIAIMGRWIEALMSVPQGYQRQQTWHELCLAAKEQHAVLNASLELQKGFGVSDQLKRWASVTPASTGSTMAPQRTR